MRWPLDRRVFISFGGAIFYTEVWCIASLSPCLPCAHYTEHCGGMRLTFAESFFMHCKWRLLRTEVLMLSRRVMGYLWHKSV